MCSFTDFITFSNACNDICFLTRLKQTFGKKSLFNKTTIVLSIAKSDEIGKKAHLVWLKEVSQDFIN